MELSLAQRIREYRKSKGISMSHVARQIGMKPNRLGSIEIGRIKLSADDFEKICKVLEVDPSIFFDGNNGKESEIKDSLQF